MDRFISDDTHPCKSYTNEFPSPLEVDRFISDYAEGHQVAPYGYRPLSRWIGLYHVIINRAIKDEKKVSVPSRGI